MSSHYPHIQYLISIATPPQLPADEGLEVAFAGRSNAGKSSALNTLTGRKGLARIGKKPGHTRTINYFQIDPQRSLVDLPGYGYAKVPLEMRRQWQNLVSHYLQHRQALQGLFVLMDIRHPLTSLDRQLLDWSTATHTPIRVLLTKADKLGYGAGSAVLAKIRKTLKKDYPYAIPCQLFSSHAKTGVDEACEQLSQWLQPEDVT